MSLTSEVVVTRGYRILGVDPGKTTGLFAVTVTQECVEAPRVPDDVRHRVRCDLSVAQVPVADVAQPVVNWLAHAADSAVPSVVALERYVITARTARLSQQPAALEVSGVVKHLAREAGVRVVEQLKSNAAKLASDERLRQLGWHARGRRHENDAARHALFALAREDAVLFELLLTQDTISET